MLRVPCGAVRFSAVLLLALSPIASAVPGPLDDPSIRRHLEFLEGLRDRGYFDLADEYLSEVRGNPEVSEDLAPVLAFEEARGKLIEAEVAPELERRDLLLDQGRAAFDAFLKQYPDHPMTPEARVQLAQVHYQRGQTAALKAGDVEDESAREASLAAARASFGQARAAFDEAISDLENAYRAFPTGFLEQDDPQHAEREEAQRRLIDAKLKRALVDYDEAQTYPEGADERTGLLDQCIVAFKDLYDNYRVWVAGIAARMWQAKSLEEKGDLRAAMGIYNELLGHQDPRLRDLQRQVAFFKVIAHRKREEFPLAERLAREWLTLSQGDSGSYERLGVQLELARAIDEQLASEYPPAVANREALVNDLVEQLSDVVRYASPYKADAVELLSKYRDSSSVDPRRLAGLSFDDAMRQAREEMSLRSWDNAIALFRAALTKINTTRSPDRANEARYLLAFSLYHAERYHEAAVLAEFLARRYPDWDSSPAATELGMGALALAYETVGGQGRGEDLRRLEALADYTISTWPDSAQADVARMMLGDIALGQGRYTEAAEKFESVKTATHKLDARSKAASAHWRHGLELRRGAEGEEIPPEAIAEAEKARALLQSVVEEQVEARVPPTDPDRLRNVSALAEIHLAEERAAEARDLLSPHVEALANASMNSTTQPLYARLLRLRLQALINLGQTEEALVDMEALQQAETGDSLTQLFFRIGRMLEAEMEAQRERGDRVKLEASRATFERFLDGLVASQSGQSFESLQWAGEQMIALERPVRAIEILQRVLEEYPDHDRLLRTRMKLSAAYRQAGQFKEAWGVASRLIEENPRGLDFLMERCRVLEDWAQVEPGYWNVAIRYWQELARRLESARPRPAEYYECWYHVALCQVGKGNRDSARRTLKSVMALSTSLGSPEIKRNYETLLQRLGG